MSPRYVTGSSTLATFSGDFPLFEGYRVVQWALCLRPSETGDQKYQLQHEMQFLEHVTHRTESKSRHFPVLHA